MNPFKLLLGSRKFWLLILDAVVSTLIVVLTQVLSPDQLDFALKLIAIYQPIFIFVIGAIAYEDGKIVPAKIEAELAEKYEAPEG